ncbi:g2343 [Coccomyxa viridis]|uniref:G2343 protein n=1 Tax=Coccomyxa viridis TaxID=1274662 RepID=A0ABP1FS53_9CHLO
MTGLAPQKAIGAYHRYIATRGSQHRSSTGLCRGRPDHNRHECQAVEPAAIQAASAPPQLPEGVATFTRATVQVKLLNRPPSRLPLRPLSFQRASRPSPERQCRGRRDLHQSDSAGQAVEPAAIQAASAPPQLPEGVATFTRATVQAASAPPQLPEGVATFTRATVQVKLLNRPPSRLPLRPLSFQRASRPSPERQCSSALLPMKAM